MVEDNLAPSVRGSFFGSRGIYSRQFVRVTQTVEAERAAASERAAEEQRLKEVRRKVEERDRRAREAYEYD